MEYEASAPCFHDHQLVCVVSKAVINLHAEWRPLTPAKILLEHRERMI